MGGDCRGGGVCISALLEPRFSEATGRVPWEVQTPIFAC